jgi:hypothetical protein
MGNRYLQHSVSIVTALFLCALLAKALECG